MDSYNKRLRNGDTGESDGPNSYYRALFWQVGAYKFKTTERENGCIIGAELGNKPVLDGMDIETVSTATWVVFKITSKSGTREAEESFTRIFTEWFPASKYTRNESAPTLEVYPASNANSDMYKWKFGFLFLTNKFYSKSEVVVMTSLLFYILLSVDYLLLIFIHFPMHPTHWFKA